MRILRYLPAVGLLITVVACGGPDQPDAAGTGGAAGRGDVAVNKDAYPVFPDADAGADPAVPADQGGRGFTGEGWETNTTYDLVGDPRAVKGGVFREWELNFPGTLRIFGPETYAFNQQLMRDYLALTASVPVFRLTYPRSFDRMDAILDTVVKSAGR